MSNHNFMQDFDSIRQAVQEGRVSHTRSCTGCWRGLVNVYGYDPESPTGVRLIGALPDNPSVLQGAGLVGSLSPLSPNEPR